MAIIRRRHLPPKEHAGHKKLDSDPVSFVGRIESVERHSEKPGSRYTIIIDAFDARLDPDALGLPLPEWDRSRLAIVRVMTTADRFARMAGLEGAFDADGNELLAGLWVQLELLRPGNRSEPRAQLCRLGERGYEEPEILAVSDITSFGFDPTEPVSLGAAANRGSVLAARARRRGILYGLPLRTTVSRSDLRATREKLIASHTAKVVVHDVGHASMTTLVDVSGAPILHFDAGWPIGFNRKTYPKNEPSAPFANLVVLSHWDWDHLHGYHKWPGIRHAIWCVPDQELGLNAKLVAEDLMNRKRLILVPPGRRTSFQFNSIQIICNRPIEAACLPASAGVKTRA